MDERNRESIGKVTFCIYEKDEEKKEIISFYGEKKVKTVLNTDNIAAEEFPVMKRARIR